MPETGNPAKSPCAIVTGAASGIGLAISRTLVQNGYKVGLLDVDSENGERAAESLRQIGPVTFVKCDVSKSQEADAAVKKVCDEFGTVDLLVNNAAILGPADLLASNDSDLAAVLATNLGGTLYMSKRCIQVMKARHGGQVINVGSIVGLKGAPDYPCYAASKAGVICLTRSLARKFARHNIRVNCISPGSVGQTGLLRRSRGSDITSQEKLAVLKNIPVGRMIKAEEIAELVLYMVSPQASGMNGANIVLDGGEVLGA